MSMRWQDHRSLACRPLILLRLLVSLRHVSCFMDLCVLLMNYRLGTGCWPIARCFSANQCWLLSARASARYESEVRFQHGPSYEFDIATSGPGYSCAGDTRGFGEVRALHPHILSTNEQPVG